MEEKVLIINGSLWSLSYKDNRLNVDAKSLAILGDEGWGWLAFYRILG